MPTMTDRLAASHPLKTEQISIRLPVRMVEIFSALAAAQGTTRNQVLLVSLEYALDKWQAEGDIK